MIIVTGASKGLGAAICERLISEGHSVYGLARDVSGLKFDGQECDVSSYDEVKGVAQTLKKNKSEVTGIVNAAGTASLNLAVTTPPHITQKIIQTNLVGTIYCCQLFPKNGIPRIEKWRR